MPVGIQTGHSAARLLPRASAAFLLGNGGGGNWEGLETHPRPIHLLLLITSLPRKNQNAFIGGRGKSSETEGLDAGTLEPKLVSPHPISIAIEQFQGHWDLCGSDVLLPSPLPAPVMLLRVKVRIGAPEIKTAIRKSHQYKNKTLSSGRTKNTLSLMVLSC